MATDYFKRKSIINGSISKVLGQIYPELSYNFLMKLLRKKDVFLNGKRAAENSVVKMGDELDLFLRPDLVPIKVVFKNEDIMAVYKPKGVQSDGEPSFSSLVKYVYPSSILMHRLDTNTDGLLLFALNSKAEKIVGQAMKTGMIQKEYKAVVYGEVDWKDKTLIGYLVKDPLKGKVRIYDHNLKGAERVELKASTKSIKDGTTTLSVIICGGKTHQIRAQLAAAGYFILGDGKYGDDRINKLYNKKSQELTAVKLSFKLDDDVLGLNDVVISL